MKKVKVKTHKKPKTKRIYNPVYCINDLLRELKAHGEKTIFSYYRTDKTLADISYIEFYNMIRSVAAALTKMGYAGKKIAVSGESSPEWLCMYLAALAVGGVAIPMDRELNPSETAGFLKWVNADAFCFSRSLVKASGEIFNDGLENLLYVAFDAESAPDYAATVESLIEDGQDVEDYEFPDMSDRNGELAEYLFTSGTTGSSKCVMLSQKNIFSVVTCACETVDFNPDDTVVSVLPMHHTYELAVTLAEMVYGAHICINDSLSHTIKNFKLFRPTGLVLVPLFLYTMHKKIWAEARSSGKENKLKLGIVAAGTMNAVGLDVRRKLFAEVLSAFGGRLEKIICGGAALDPLMIEAFENFGISVYEGYGITECAPLAAVTPYYARKYGSVGKSVPCCEISIDASGIGESGYPEGEIVISGDNVMLGYYDNPAANEEVFTEDGAFRTGDVGYLDDDGYLFITGRKKSVIVLENGKNVFPEEIEEYLTHIEQISECVVVGRKAEGSRIELVAIVYPNYDAFPDGADEDAVHRALEQSIASVNRKLPTFKRVMKVEVRGSEFEKTSAKKIKRYLIS